MNVVLHDGKYFDVETKEMIDFSTIHIEGKYIHCIDNDHFEENNIDTEINCLNKYVLPGFVDSHIHFFQSGGIYTRPDGLDLRHIKSYEKEIIEIKENIEELFRRYLACGVTGVIDNGGPFWNKEIVEKGKSQKPHAPIIAWAGPLVSTVAREKLDIGDPPIIKAENENHAKELVHKCFEHNPDFIKFWYIYQEESFEKDSKIMKTGISEAKLLGKPVMVHATELETARRAIEYGADILVHSVVDSDVDQEFIEMLNKKDVIYIPTLVVFNGYQEVYRTRLNVSDFEQKWGDPKAFQSFRDLMTLSDDQIPESHRKIRHEYDTELVYLHTHSFPNLRRIHGTGIKVATGTDAGNVGTLHGPSIHAEMATMVEAGLDPDDVIVCSTKNGAELLGIDAGEINPGKLANLVVLNSDPLDSITATRSIKFVINLGVVFKPSDLIEPTTPEMIVDTQLEAYRNRDLDAFLKCYHPRIQIFDLLGEGVQVKGLDEMKEVYTKLFRESPNLDVEVLSRFREGQMVVDQEKVTGYRGDKVVTAGVIYEIKNHLITKVWFTR